MKTTSRNLNLDLLRAVAILLVLVNHIPAQFIGNSILAEIVWTVRRGGWTGVDLFFVLSGFLVSGIYFREYQKTGNISIGNFLIRRGLKIYPAFYLLILFTVVFFSILRHPINTKVLLGELLFIQNYTGSFWGVNWSLAVEEHFYIFLTILFFIFKRHIKTDIFRYVPIVFIFITVICLSLRVYTNLSSEYNFGDYFAKTQLRMDSLMFGVLIAYFYYFKPERLDFISKNKYLYFFLSLLLVLPFFLIAREYKDNGYSILFISTIGLAILYLSYGLTLISFNSIKIKESLFTRMISEIGKSSYSIYLWHIPVVKYVESFMDSLWVGPVYILLCIILGVTLTRLIELPILALRDRIMPSKSGFFINQPPTLILN